MICPNCQSEQKVTENHYGALYTCTSCQAVYFINFDGQPEYGEASSEEYASANAANLALEQAPEGFAPTMPTPIDDLNNMAMPDPLPEEMGSLEPQLSVTETLEPQTQIDSYIAEFNSSGTPENNLSNPFELQNNMESLNTEAPTVIASVASIAPTPAPVTRQPMPPPPVAVDIPAAPVRSAGVKPDFTSKPQVSSNLFADIAQEISDFANTDSQLAGLNYDVVITGIDTQETKMLFKEAIEDSKFAWDAFELMKSIKNGRIEIFKISPAKAFLLAKRIQFLDIEKNWKQNVLS